MPLSTFCQKNSRIAAKNLLLTKINQHLVAFIDSKTTLDPHWATHCVAVIKNIGVAVTCSPIYQKGDPRRSLELNSSALLINKYCLEKIDGFRKIPKNLEGIDLAFRFAAQGYHLGIVSRAKSSGPVNKFPLGHYGKRLWPLFHRKNKSAFHYSKFLSWEGKVYILNRWIALCIDEIDITAIDIRRYRLFPIDNYQAQSLREIIKDRLIMPTFVGPLRFLTESKLLIQVKKREGHGN